MDFRKRTLDTSIGMQQETKLQTAAELLLIEIKIVRDRLTDLEKKMCLEFKTITRVIETLEAKLEQAIRRDDG